MKSILFKQKDPSHGIKEFSITKYRNLREKLMSLEQIEFLLPDTRHSFGNLFSFVSRIDQRARVMFIIAKETRKNIPVYRSLISEQLTLLNPNNRAKKKSSNGYVKPIVDALEDEGKLIKNRKCPHCDYDYGIRDQGIPEICVDCHQPIFPEEIKSKKASSRPNYTVKLTESGEAELKEVIDSFIKACYFCFEWLKFSNSKT